MTNNCKDIYTAPQISVSDFISTDVFCASNTARTESFTEEVELEW